MKPLVIGALLTTASWAMASPAMPMSADAQAGAALFRGAVRLSNGGPTCASCHPAAGLPFPYGGSMGPDLTDEYAKLGPLGLRYTLATLYFPAMNALFLHRQLSVVEQHQLAEFFRAIDGRRPVGSALGWLALAGAGGLVLLLAATALYGRRRIRSVRRALLARVRAEGGRR